MATKVYKDSFGQEVNVGDYVAFVPKTKGFSTQFIGVVQKFTPRGRVVIKAVNTYGKTAEEYFADTLAHRKKLRAEVKHDLTHDPTSWKVKYHAGALTDPNHNFHESKDEEASRPRVVNSRLESTSSCVRLPGPPSVALTQLLA